MERKLGWKWFRPQSPHPAEEAVKGPAVLKQCQSCWNDSPLGAEMVVLRGRRWTRELEVESVLPDP